MPATCATHPTRTAYARRLCRSCYDSERRGRTGQRARRGSIAGSVEVGLDAETLVALTERAGADGPSVVEWVREAIRMRLATRPAVPPVPR